MALLFADGFDHYAASQITTKWTYNGTSGLAFGGPGRVGYGQYAEVASGGGVNPLGRAFPTQSTVIVGFAYYYPGTGPANGNIFWFGDNTASQLGLIQMTSSGQLLYSNGSGTQVAISAPAQFNTQAWCYIEAQITFSNASSGSVAIRLNGVTIASVGSVNTSGTNGNGCSMAGPCAVANSGYCYYDDIYMLNTTAPNNAFLGDVKIVPLYPTGNGRISGLSRFGGTSAGNYTAVQDVPPDGDTSYVYTATPGTSDAYTITALSNVTNIKAVQIGAFARKDDTPSRTLGLGVGNGTTENYDSGHSLNTTYTYVLRQMDQNPLTSATWATGDFSTLQLAQQLIS